MKKKDLSLKMKEIIEKIYYDISESSNSEREILRPLWEVDCDELDIDYDDDQNGL